MGTRQDVFMNNLKITCTISIIVGILGVSVDIEEYTRFLLLTLSLNNFSIFAYKVLIEKFRISERKLLISYLIIIALEFVSRKFFYDINVNIWIIYINLYVSIFSFAAIQFNRANSEYSEYSDNRLLNFLSILMVISTIACLLSVKNVATLDKMKFASLSQFILCVVIYIYLIYLM